MKWAYTSYSNKIVLFINVGENSNYLLSIYYSSGLCIPSLLFSQDCVIYHNRHFPVRKLRFHQCHIAGVIIYQAMLHAGSRKYVRYFKQKETH